MWVIPQKRRSFQFRYKVQVMTVLCAYMGADHDRRSVRYVSKAKRVHTSVYLSNSLWDKRCCIPLVWKPQECPDPLCSPLLIGHHASQSCLVITGCSEHAPKVINSPKKLLHNVVSVRLEICRDRRDRRSCKIFPSCVKFWGNNANSLGNYRVTYALNE